MENKVILYGASGHGKVIIDILVKSKTEINFIIDDNPKYNFLLGFEVKKTADIDLANLSNIIISIGNNFVRKKIAETINNKFYKAIHPNSAIAQEVNIGEGTVIMANAVVNSDTKIGNHVIINSGAIIEHDCNIENFAHISPKAALAGGVSIGEGTHVGIGASVLQNVKIGKWATIGAGAVVLNDVPDFAVAVGNPAKIIKFNDENE